MNHDSLKDCKLYFILGNRSFDFKFSVGQHIIDNKRNLTIVKCFRKDRDNDNASIRYYSCHCNECNKSNNVSEYELVRGTGCKYCCKNSKIITVGLNDVWTTNPELAKLFANSNDGYKYTQCSSKRIDFCCPECGSIIKNKVIRDVLHSGLLCPCCSDGRSYPERLMYNLLLQLNINFEYQYSPKWIKPKRYDFYIPSMQLIIETDGGLGHGCPNKLLNQTEEETLLLDQYKDRLAQEHHMKVVRIDCKKSEFEYIKDNIMNNKMLNKLNLSNINWIKISKDSCRTLVKTVCDIKNNNDNITASQISNIINIGARTIRKYLKIGTKLGWCNYDPNKERIRQFNKNKKPVMIFKDNIYLDTYMSIADLSKCSVKQFGVFLNDSDISRVCNNKRKQCKGFSFKYINSI